MPLAAIQVRWPDSGISAVVIMPGWGRVPWQYGILSSSGIVTTFRDRERLRYVLDNEVNLPTRMTRGLIEKLDGKVRELGLPIS